MVSEYAFLPISLVTMDTLRQKIEHARSTDRQLSDLPFADIPSLIREREADTTPFLIYHSADGERTELSFEQFCLLVNKTAGFLRQKGLRPGDRVATISHNHWHTVVHYFAAWILGLVVVPVNLGEDDERIAYILDNGKVELAFVRWEYKDRINALLRRHDNLKNIQRVFCDDSTDSFTTDEEVELDNDIDYSDSDALIVFTSGTTGAPKGVVLSQRNLLEDARAIAEWHNIDRDTRMMCVLPIHHVNGTVVTLMTPFFAGGSTVLNQKFQVSRFFPTIEEEEVHIVSVVPTLLQYLTSYYEERELDVPSSLRHIICGAGPLTIEVAINFEERFEVPIIHGYGLSETTCYSCFLPVEQSPEEHHTWMQDHGYPSIGIAIPPNEMDIQDTEGASMAEGERGEIVIRGVNVMKGYYKNREANEKAFKNGWFRSGDEGFYRKGEDGKAYYFITGRLKELIIRGGVNLAPLEIDEVINWAPGVKAGIAVGFENDWYGEEVGAYIQPAPDADPDPNEIIAFCREHLPYSKSPKVIVFGQDIPVTSTGKYQRRKVAHLFDEWKSVQFRPESQ